MYLSGYVLCTAEARWLRAIHVQKIPDPSQRWPKPLSCLNLYRSLHCKVNSKYNETNAMISWVFTRIEMSMLMLVTFERNMLQHVRVTHGNICHPNCYDSLLCPLHGSQICWRLIKKAEVCLMRQYIYISRCFCGICLRPNAYLNCGFESRRRNGRLSLVSVVCCQVEVFASSRSLVQRIPTECVWVIQCDLKNFRNEAGEAGVGLLR